MGAEITSSVSNRIVSNDRFAAAYRVLDNAISAHAFPGCAFGVLAGGEIVLQDARGAFTYEEGSPMVTAATVFDVASVTKVVSTTAIAMLLYQRGLLDLDMPLGDLLPAFVLERSNDKCAHHVKIRHLLAHNSGMPGYVEFFRTVATSSELLTACLQLPIETEPGTRQAYSDPGFILLGKALEVSLREGLEPWVQREVFNPLGMRATGFTPGPEKRSLIPPTEEDTTFRHRRIQGEVQDENAWVLGGIAGHAGLFSNVPDMLRFASEILDSSRGIASHGKKPNLFDPPTIEMFCKRQQPAGSSRALGWDTPSLKSSSGRHFSPHSIGHLGYSGCSLWIDLDARVAVVLLTNRTWPDRQCQLIRQIRPSFHDAAREALA